MSLVKTGISALGKLLVVIVLAASFVFGMVGVVWLSLRGEAVTVPEVVGKDFMQSEQELASLGLKIKRRSFRYSQEKPNTIIEQAPRAGDTVKTGQTILVVVAQANPEGTEAPAPAKKDDDVESTDSTDDSTEKTKKTNSNTKVKKPEKTRDVITNKANKNANSEDSNSSNSSNSNKIDTTNGSENKNGTTSPANKSTPKPTPKPNKTPVTPNDRPAATSGDTRNRRVN